jgi:hypothetical protein
MRLAKSFDFRGTFGPDEPNQIVPKLTATSQGGNPTQQTIRRAFAIELLRLCPMRIEAHWRAFMPKKPSEQIHMVDGAGFDGFT